MDSLVVHCNASAAVKNLFFSESIVCPSHTAIRLCNLNHLVPFVFFFSVQFSRPEGLLSKWKKFIL